MSEDFEKLKKIGAQKIYEKTHIARVNIEYILNKSFDELPKIQFRGFIAILEREYKLNLQDLLAEYEAHRVKDEEIVEYIKIDKKEYGKFDQKIILLALVATLIIGYLIISSLTHSTNETTELNNSEIETAKANIERNTTVVKETNSSELNQSVELNTSENTTAPKMPNVVQGTKSSKFQIIPEKMLWMAYTDLGTKKHKQERTADSIDLNASNNYIIETGHGFLKIDTGSGVKEFSGESKKYFKFENGELTELSRTEYKKLNKSQD